jgi:hypothetical protein
MDDAADVSSQNRSGWHLLDGCVSTRNWKVVGSNPTSGSKTAGQMPFPGLLAAWRQQAVIALGSDQRATGAPAPLRYVGVPRASPLGRGSDAVRGECRLEWGHPGPGGR